MSKARRHALPNSEPGRAHGHFTDREAKVWAAEQAHSGKQEAIAVLLVSPVEQDHVALREILARPGFLLVSSHSAQEADAILRKKRVPVVVAECNLKDCCWKDMWCAIQRLPKPWPRLIVAAENPADVLWAEVLDLGACDVLAKPFNREEVVWCVRDAWLAWSRQVELERGLSRRAAVMP